jgi:hypothetical protein
MSKTKIVIATMIFAIMLGTALMGAVRWDPLNQLDEHTNAVATVDYAHYEIHGGSSYIANHYAAAVASTNSLDCLLVTADSTKAAHLIYFVAATDEAVAYFYADVTTSADGTALTEHNRNMRSSNTAETVATHTPTVSDTGTLIRTFPVNGAKLGAGAVRDAEEFILAANTKYLLRITSGAAGNGISCEFDWYEHTSKSSNTRTSEPFRPTN